GGANTLTITGTLTDNTGSSTNIGANNDTTDTASVGLLSNAGAVTVGTGATLTIDTAGSDPNSGTIALKGSTLDLKAATALTGKGTVNLTKGVIAGIGSGVTLTSSNTIEGSGAIENLGITNNGIMSAIQAGTLSILPTAAGLKNNGALEVGSGATMKIGTSAGGALTNFAGDTLTGGTYNVSGTLEFGASGTTIANNAANITLNGTGVISDFGGNNILAGFNNNTSTGVFKLASAAVLTTSAGNFTNAGLFTVSAGTTFTIGGSSFNFTQTGGSATIDGTLTSTTLGTLALNGGSLDGVGTLGYNVVDSSILTPGDSATVTGKLTVADTYAQSSSGTLDIEINGATAGTNYDVLRVAKAATLGGILDITLGSGFTPTIGETFTILTAGSLSDTFADVNGLAINSSEHFTITYNGHSVVLTVVSGALPALSPTLTQLARHTPGLGGRFGLDAYSSQHAQTPSVTPALGISLGGPASFQHPGTGLRGFRPMDESGAIPVLTSSAAGPTSNNGSLGFDPAPAAALSSLSQTNHMRFECGVDLKALLNTRPKRLLRALWAAPDSPEALAIGYMSYNGSH
uniref:beta strand repeat-containing protein n=1 Tax=Nevskia soli TaxID=418856 RepID=UPI0015D91763